MSYALLSLKSRVLRAGSWSIIIHIVSFALRLGSSLITTRLFTPDIFGIMTMVMAINVLVSLLSDIGLHQAIVRSPNGENRLFLNTAWTLQILRGCFIWGICVCIAAALHIARTLGYVPADSAYAAPILPDVFVFATFSAVIVGCQSMKAVLVSRNLDLKRVGLIELLSQITGLLIVILFGWMTKSIWAFVAGALISSITATFLSHVWLHGPSDRLAWDRNAIVELSHFGRWIFASSAVGAAVINGDRLLLAAWVDPTVISFYSIAANLSSVVEALVNRLFGAVIFPALSEIARLEPSKFATTYFRFRWITDSIFVGVAGFLFASGEAVVGFLYDARYAEAGPMLKWLSFSLLFTRYGLAQSAYLALGHPKYVAAINVVRAVSLFILVPLFFHAFGVRGAVMGIAFHAAPTLLLVYFFNNRHGLNNIRLEIGVLGLWPLGWIVGLAAVTMAHILRPLS